MKAQEREQIIKDEALKAAYADDPVKASERVISIIERHNELLEMEKMREFVKAIEIMPKQKSVNANVNNWPDDKKATFWENRLKKSRRNYLTVRSSH